MITILRCRYCGEEIRIQHINPLVKGAWICSICGGELEVVEQDKDK